MALRPTLLLGYLSRAHGLHGQLVLKRFDPGSEAVFGVSRLHLTPRQGAPRTVKLKAASPLAGPEVLLELRGVGSRVVAEALVGAQVAVFRQDVPPPEEGQYFFGDLTGLTARTPEGQALGEVAQVFQAGPVPNLVIHAEGKEELMIPFAEDFVRKVDLEAGEIIVVVPEYG